jgi:TonB-linked SusC/RagA family outer membrane protein
MSASPVMADQLSEISNTVSGSTLVSRVSTTKAKAGKEYSFAQQAQNESHRLLSGTVVDDDGAPLPGVAVFIKQTSTHAITDINGVFRLQIPTKAVTVSFSYIGMKPQDLRLDAGEVDVTKKKVVLHSNTQIQEVVVTGIVTKDKNSFTGSASTFSGEDLRSIGVQNPIASLSALDPAFNVLTNDIYGSDPNHLPDINIRGKSSVIGLRDETVNDSNQPLFIVDGFESTLEAVYNLDLNRIASMNILKDAASTAIYGSKAANGVVVVETVKPEAGKLRLSYNGSAAVSKPDLSSYNMMNAAEKLEFDRLAGRFSLTTDDWSVEKEILNSNTYNTYLAQVASGVNTYWLSVPLRSGLNQKHNVYVEGGEGAFLFGLGATYNGVTGVMKQSDRNTYGGNLDLIYRMKNLRFQNQLSVSQTSSENPVVGFSSYAQTSPYYKKTDENGEITKWLENSDFAEVRNPLYDASLNSYDKSSYLLLTNYFIAEYTPLKSLKIRAKFGLSHQSTDDKTFISPQATTFEKLDVTKRGTYDSDKTKKTSYSASLTGTYAEVFGNHRVTLAVDAKATETRTTSDGYTAEGFPEGDFAYPSFAAGYKANGVPSYSENLTRSTSLLGTLNYAYDNRYLADFNYTLSGSSVFGASKRFINTWSVGIGWNLMNEKFFKDRIHGVSMLKLRASIGNPGNQDFESSMSLVTYKFMTSSYNYFGNSTTLYKMGNKNLKWQTTIDRNIGFDLTMLNDRLNVEFDYYNKVTDPLLISVSVPLSTGVNSTLSGSSYWYTNLGKQKSNGVLAVVNYYLIRNLSDRITWNVRGTLRHENIKLYNIDGQLEDLNTYAKTTSTKRYYDGADPDAIWAVRSAGIDPSNGKEMFIKKDGSYTYDYSVDDEVIVGNTRAKIEGNLGTNLSYKGFTAGLTFGYKWGGKSFNTSLYNKVENIDSKSLIYNQDKRALYDRWQKAGDMAQFKDIANSVSTPMSSRFVQKNNSLTLNTLQLGYDFYKIAPKLGVEALRLSAYANDLFWLSTIKQERGTTYPYARSFTFALSFTL